MMTITTESSSDLRHRRHRLQRAKPCRMQATEYSIIRRPDILLNPNRWVLFGGGEEPIDQGNQVVTWCRELHEELGIVVKPAHIRPMGERQWWDGTLEYLFYCEWPSLTTAFVMRDKLRGFIYAFPGCAEDRVALRAGDDIEIVGNIHEHPALLT